jgi:predicted Zn-dependent peptidase
VVLVVSSLWWSMPQSSALAQATPSGDRPNRSSSQPYLDRVISRISEFTLDNGMKFIVMERHQAPVVSFMTYVNVGSAYEQKGKTGAAHFMEHLAFKGTTQIGTKDFQAEKPLLTQMDALFDKIQADKTAGRTDDAKKLQQEFDKVQADAESYVKQNEFGQIVTQYGGVGLNATTSADATRYFYSFPANKLELWMSLESERFMEPVFREFFEEKQVILEERRMRTDNSPIGKMIETFLQTALPGHPYGRPVIGYEDDIRNLSREDIENLYSSYYTPDRIIVGIVGDVDPKQVKQLAEAYFGRFNAQSNAADVQAVAPTQTGPKEVTLQLPTQPWYMEGYQRPAITDPDNAVYEMINGILVGGRTARLYKSLVEQKQLALSVSASDGFPGDRYSNLMLIYAQTAPGHTVDELATALDAELNRLKQEPVSEAELDQVRTQTRAGILQVLASNEGMASLLPEYEAKTGSWRNLFEELTAIEAVTAADVQRVAQSLFQPNKLTVGKLLSASTVPGVEIDNRSSGSSK